jgi:polyisoprenoid-binding protein YceI
MSLIVRLLSLASLAGTGVAAATPATYRIDPNHADPLFEVDHFNGLSIGSFSRADFGVNAGMQYGFRQEITLRIQVEAIRQD